jgi:deoxyribonuclease-4
MELDELFIRGYYNVGHHTKKESTLLATVKKLSEHIPYQIFLSGPQNSKVSANDEDIIATAKYIREHNLSVFIHTPYILNLATEFKEGEWQYTLFQKYIEIGVSMGAKGVVIHVAKHTKQPYSTAIETMRKNLKEFSQYASVGCPILLETPAGQGTETLKGMSEFYNFVNELNDERIRICLDTCHVFACGHDPLLFLNLVLPLLKLVHYNDSQDVCGSCLDRHAIVGSGKIGIYQMTEIAYFCKKNSIPMVIE